MFKALGIPQSAVQNMGYPSIVMIQKVILGSAPGAKEQMFQAFIWILCRCILCSLLTHAYYTWHKLLNFAISAGHYLSLALQK